MLVISARHGDGQKIRLLDAGADDYLVKPFSVGELLARMRVALRHRGTSAAARRSRSYEHDGLRVDLAARNGAALTAQPVHLTPTEFKLLARLVRSAGQVVTHRQLLTDVWGAEYVEHTHYLRLYMAQLRAKLEADPAEPQLLLTEPGVGYRLVEAPADSAASLCVPDARPCMLRAPQRQVCDDTFLSACRLRHDRSHAEPRSQRQGLAALRSAPSASSTATSAPARSTR